MLGRKPPPPKRDMVGAFHIACEQTIAPEHHQYLLEALQQFLGDRSLDRLAAATLYVLPTRELRARVLPPMLGLMPQKDAAQLQSLLKRHLAKQRKQDAAPAAATAKKQRRVFTLSLGRRKHASSGGSSASNSSSSLAPAGRVPLSSAPSHFPQNQHHQHQQQMLQFRQRANTLNPSLQEMHQQQAAQGRRRLLTLGSGSVSSSGSTATPLSSSASTSSTLTRSSQQPKARKVKLQRNKFGQLGLNLRGGAEYGVGIYISKVGASEVVGQVEVGGGEEMEDEGKRERKRVCVCVCE